MRLIKTEKNSEKERHCKKVPLVKVPLNVKIVQQDLLHKKQFLKIL